LDKIDKMTNKYARFANPQWNIIKVWENNENSSIYMYNK
jgi:hypothetical protein